MARAHSLVNAKSQEKNRHPNESDLCTSLFAGRNFFGRGKRKRGVKHSEGGDGSGQGARGSLAPPHRKAMQRFATFSLALTFAACAPEGAPADDTTAARGAGVIFGADDKTDPVCFPKGSIEKALVARVAILEPDDGTMPCTGFLVGNAGQPSTQYLLSVGRCRPRPNVAVVAWFGSGRAVCGAKAVNVGYPFLVGPMVASVATGGPLNDAPALFTLDSDAWPWSGLSVHESAPTIGQGTTLVLPQSLHDADGRRLVVASHAQSATECRAGLGGGGVFSHNCDTGAATSGAHESQGAPILIPSGSTGWAIAGMNAGPNGATNAGYNLTALAPLLALVPYPL